MTAARELNIKPSCAHEIHAFPSDQAGQLWEKISRLVDDPIPDGKLKKKLKGKSDLCRLRVGDYRLFYSFGDTWIRLVAIRRRESTTYGNKSAALRGEAPTHLPPRGDEAEIERALRPSEPPPVAFDAGGPTITSTPLPRPITHEWLSSLRIPIQYHAALVLATSEEALLAAGVPGPVLERVVDSLFPKPLAEVVKEPDLAVQDPGDLARFKEGTLTSFLLRLDAEQEKLVAWALKGPTLIRGGAGTGKSTILLYRVRALLRRPGATGRETVLFTTYTRALEAVSQQLLSQILTPEELTRVRVATVDGIAREIVERKRRIRALETDVRGILERTRAAFEPQGPNAFERKLRRKALARISTPYLLDELQWILEGREIETLAEYEAAPRPGRGIAFGSKMRGVVWELYEAFRERLREKGTETFSGLRREACELANEQRGGMVFDHVLVDEAQDLPPVALRLLTLLAKSPEGIALAADTKQSIYAKGAGFGAADARLQLRGRTSILRRNYRSTAEIDRAAFCLLSEDEPEDKVASESAHTGPIPVCLAGAAESQEGQWAASFIREMAKHLRMSTHAAAVLVPNRAVANDIVEGMQRHGISARFFEGRDLDLAASVTKVMTFHSAKGLEFPIVVVAGLRPGTYPTPDQEAETGAYAEAMQHHRRLLYVACTRAMRGLMLIRTDTCDDAALRGLSEAQWTIREAP